MSKILKYTTGDWYNLPTKAIINLNPLETELVKKIVAFQLNTLDTILAKDFVVDLAVYSTNNEVSSESIREHSTLQREELLAVYKNPNTIGTLKTRTLSILRHYIFSQVTNPKYNKARYSLTSKFILLDSMEILSSPN